MTSKTNAFMVRLFFAEHSLKIESHQTLRGVLRVREKF
jgi:hypothetical protein